MKELVPEASGGTGHSRAGQEAQGLMELWLYGARFSFPFLLFCFVLFKKKKSGLLDRRAHSQFESDKQTKQWKPDTE